MYTVGNIRGAVELERIVTVANHVGMVALCGSEGSDTSVDVGAEVVYQVVADVKSCVTEFEKTIVFLSFLGFPNIFIHFLVFSHAFLNFLDFSRML